jgi:ABC-2 type transport system permease protein
MTFSMRRFQAIVNKEWKDAIKNPQILLMAGLPILMAFLFSKLDNSAATTSTPILMALVMTGAFIQAMMVAEEKEKNTLRVLMLSPAKTSEILLGKSILTSIITLLVIVVVIAIADIKLTNIPLISLLTLLQLVMFIALGTIIGLLSRSVQESSFVGLPVLFIFLFGPMFGPLLENELLLKLVHLLPTDHFSVAFIKLVEGGSFADVSSSLINIAIWMVASLVLAVIVYSKRRFDK